MKTGETIKTKWVCAGLLLPVAGGLMMMSGCTVMVTPAGPPPPVVVAPAPVVVEVPDYYTWDGVEYVGFVGDQYYYLGPGQVWLVCDPVRVERFHTWAGYHPDWRDHMTHNDNFRRDAHGDFHPMAEGGAERGRPPVQENNHPMNQAGAEHADVHGNVQKGGAQKKPAPKKKKEQQQ